MGEKKREEEIRRESVRKGVKWRLIKREREEWEREERERGRRREREIDGERRV